MKTLRPISYATYIQFSGEIFFVYTIYEDRVRSQYRDGKSIGSFKILVPLILSRGGERNEQMIL